MGPWYDIALQMHEDAQKRAYDHDLVRELERSRTRLNLGGPISLVLVSAIALVIFV